MSDRLVTVVVPLPLLGTLTYRLPGGLEVRPGVRVLVPLGVRQVTACVVAVEPDVDATAAERPVRTLKTVLDVLDEAPYFPADVLELTRWVADYYLCSVGESLSAAAPPFTWVESRSVVRASPRSALTQGGQHDLFDGLVLEVLRDGGACSERALVERIQREQPGHSARDAQRAIRRLERLGAVVRERPIVGRADAFRWRRVVRLVGAHPDARQTSTQALAISLLREKGGECGVSELAAAGVSLAVVRRLEQRGEVTISRVAEDRDPFAGDASERGAAGRQELVLTDDQRAALEALLRMSGTQTFKTALLHGVTGSGKTEVYLRLAQSVQQQGRGVLMLVPEIALTPVVARQFRHVFGERVAVQHSGLSDGERHDQWHRIRRGDVDVVVGTRSAVFAPVRSLGLVIVDEEHDPSYKQDEAPRYHGRDVAVMRAKHAGALVVLGSATPSLETFQNAMVGRYARISLAHRVLDRPLATVHLVDMREEYATHGPEVVVSERLATALRDCLGRGEQAVVLLNRRGFATSLLCRACGSTLDCPHCSITLTVHKGLKRARCHYCDYALALPEACAVCGGSVVEYQGVGTERVEAELRQLLPEGRIARVDRDTVRRRGAVTALLSQFAARRLDVLVGTQMIAKGHDFPQVTLVGVISADVGLGLADFRAAERTFQLLTQVAGRAGRGEQAGEAIIQTLYPGHYSIALARTQEYGAFFERELEYRSAMHYPPLLSLVNIIVKGETLRDAFAHATELVRAMRPVPPAVQVLGPAPAPLVKLRGLHRAQIFLKVSDRRAARDLVRRALDRCAAIRRFVTVDVDPVGVL